MLPPSYFAAVEEQTRIKWDHRLADPEEAGPWWQLFEQVRDPLHVLSELLQNADDAKARSARVALEGDEFVFEHDGEDFNEDQFRSLCRFAYSNKRVLQTIGFRGIGFKSTFGLGDEVRLQTPTLDVCFQAGRFTQPVWLGEAATEGSTRITVKFRDAGARKSLEQSIDEWRKHPLSLLFFGSVERLDLNGVVVERKNLGDHAGKGARWALHAEEAREYAVFRTEPRELPHDAQAEIRAARRVDSEYEIPPAIITIVLGPDANRRIYTILPTGAKTDLAFAINAPFLQKPDRASIESPEKSPTNKWLLQQAGVLAAQALADWVSDDSLTLEERARAYELVPPHENVLNLEGTDIQAAAEVANALDHHAEQLPVLLTASGGAAKVQEATSVPHDIRAVWPDDVWATHLKPGNTVAFVASEIDEERIARLDEWGWIEPTTLQDIILRLHQGPAFPRPEKIEPLWAAVQNQLTHTWDASSGSRSVLVVGERKIDPDALKITPRIGSSELHAARELVRVPKDIGEWTRTFIASRLASADLDGVEIERYDLTRIADAMKLTKSAARNQILAKLVAIKPTTRDEIVALAFVAADLDVACPDDMPFVTASSHIRKASSHLFDDGHGTFTNAIGETLAAEISIADDYRTPPTEIAAKVATWIPGANSPIYHWIPLMTITSKENSVWSMQQFLQARGSTARHSFYAQFLYAEVKDTDLHSEIAKRAAQRATEDPKSWMKVLESLLRGKPGLARVEITEHNYNNHRGVWIDDIRPGWIERFRGLRCLCDEDGHPNVPSSLARRTPETESMAAALKFVARDIDTADNRAILDALGVQSTVRDPAPTLNTLSAITRGNHPDAILLELGRHFEVLEAIAERDPSTLQRIRAHLEAFAVIPTTEKRVPYERLHGICRTDVGESYGIPAIHIALRELPLWRMLEVAETASLDQLITWVQSLEDGPQDDATQARLKKALRSYAPAVAQQDGRWLSLSGKWQRVDEFSYYALPSDIAKALDLTDAHLHTIADCSMITDESAIPTDFTADARPLSSALAYHYDTTGAIRNDPEPSDWAQKLGTLLLKALSLTPESYKLARRLQSLSVAEYKGEILATPTLDGAIAGPGKPAEIVWQGDTIYAPELRWGKISEAFVDICRRETRERNVLDAIRSCLDRSDAYIRDYVEQNFKLDHSRTLTLTEPTRTIQPEVPTPGTPSPAPLAAPPGSNAPPQPASTKTPTKKSDVGSPGSGDEPNTDEAPSNPGENPGESDEDDQQDDATDDMSETGTDDEPDRDGPEPPGEPNRPTDKDTTLVRTHKRRHGRQGKSHRKKGPAEADAEAEANEEEEDESGTPSARRELFHAYACTTGFTHDARTDSYTHLDGRRFVRGGDISDWECIGGAGPHYYFVNARSFAEGIDLPTGVWHFMMKYPTNTVLITKSRKRPALAHSGQQLETLTKGTGVLNVAATGYFIRGDPE